MSRARLLELGFAAGLAEHLRGYEPAALLGFRCQPPRYCFASPIIQQPIAPLWECGMVLTYFDELDQMFKKCSLENIGSTWAHYRTIQAVLANLLIELYEDELSFAELRAVASRVGFEDVERFILEAQAISEPEYEKWRTAFPMSCGG